MRRSGLLNTIYCPIYGRVDVDTCSRCRYKMLCGRGV